MHALNDDLNAESELYFLQAGAGENGEQSRNADDLLLKVKALLHAFEHRPDDLRAGSLQLRPAYAKLEGTSLMAQGRAAIQALRMQCTAQSIDLVAIAKPRGLASYKLLAMDMDSTVISIECLDEVADFCGKKAEVASITEAAMRGEITDSAESLRRRVASLKGLTPDALQSV